MTYVKVYKHICRQILASLQSTQAPRQPDSPPSRFFDGAGDHLGSWALPSRAFKEASTSSSVRPCLTSQTTVSYHQVKYRTTLGKMITQIWSFSSCLVSSHPFQRFRNPPPPPSLPLSLRGCECFISCSLSSPACGFEFLQFHFYLCASG